jgi:hypothetical protein
MVHLREERSSMKTAFIEQHLDPAHRAAAAITKANRIVPDIAQFLLDPRGAKPYHFTRGSQEHASSLAFEELHVKTLLERGHRSRYCGRCTVQGFRGAPDAAGGRHDIEGMEMVKTNEVHGVRSGL